MEIDIQDRGSEQDASIIKDVQRFVQTAVTVIDAVKQGAKEIATTLQPALDQPIEDQFWALPD